MTSPCESVSPCVCEKPDCGIPYGLCHCGCGGNAPVAPRNNKFYKWIKGKPKRYIAGHGCSRINKPYLIEDRGYESPCWIWEFSLTSQGYASVEFGGKKHYVHRINYQKFVGSIPEGYELDHLCENRCCVNPYHLEPVMHRENARRGRLTILDEADVKEIKLKIAKGESRSAIAKVFGVVPATIGCIKRGELWADVGGEMGSRISQRH